MDDCVCFLYIAVKGKKKLYFVYAHNIDLYSLLFCYSYDKMTNYEAIQLGFLQSSVPLFCLQFAFPHSPYPQWLSHFQRAIFWSFFCHFLVVWSGRAHVPRQWELTNVRCVFFTGTFNIRLLENSTIERTELKRPHTWIRKHNPI